MCRKTYAQNNKLGKNGLIRNIINLINCLFSKMVLLLLLMYRYFISPFLGHNCRFYPSCSQYAKEAIVNHGVWLGIWLAFKRVSKCHPLHKGGYDPVPAIRRAELDELPRLETRD